MRKIRNNGKNKRAFTLVELVVAMALTAIFAGLCVLLIVPVTQIYTRVNDSARAQLLADTVVDSLRSECSHTHLSTAGDVVIMNSGGALLPSDLTGIDSGEVLVIKKNKQYYETLASNYAITSTEYNGVYSAEEAESGTHLTGNDGSGILSRSIYGMFSGGNPAVDNGTGYLHFGFFSRTSGEDHYSYYDFSNPIPYAAYRDFKVHLNFSLPEEYSTTSEDPPGYVLCTVTIMDPTETHTFYTRNTVLVFS
ncbi:MAG: prepilin-type N-terminal cleavage/methylation domain-containing protein [Clostridiales bacterium]|nr:prepilin-type N-terminal cleavage/methylation domain-containing protein [Clostridiales bacterium]